MVAEFAAGTLAIRYAYGTQAHVPDLLVRSGVTYRLIADQLGSVRAVVRVSDGTVMQRTDYDAWGVITYDSSASFQALGYAGGLEDRSTGLVRFGARDYEPEVGRWTCKDPAGIESDGNMYEYCRSMPVSLIDINGTVPTTPNPPPLPPGPGGSNSDIAANICEAWRHSGEVWWLWTHSKRGNVWDFRTNEGSQWDDFGNATWGAIAAAWGLDDATAQRGAGAVEVARLIGGGRLPPGWFTLPTPPYVLPASLYVSPYGDQPEDNAAIAQGEAYYRWFAKYGNCGCGAGRNK